MDQKILKHFETRYSELRMAHPFLTFSFEQMAEKFEDRYEQIRKQGGRYGFYWIDDEAVQSIDNLDWSFELKSQHFRRVKAASYANKPARQPKPVEPKTETETLTIRQWLEALRDDAKN